MIVNGMPVVQVWVRQKETHLLGSEECNLTITEVLAPYVAVINPPDTHVGSTGNIPPCLLVAYQLPPTSGNSLYIFSYLAAISRVSKVVPGTKNGSILYIHSLAVLCNDLHHNQAPQTFP